MSAGKDEQVAWLRAVLAYLGISANQLARRAGIAPSTLNRPLNDPDHQGMISGRIVAKIAAEAGLRPMEFPNKLRGFAENEVNPYEAQDGGEFDRAVRELCAGHNGRDAWVMRGYALELAGIMPGDILIVDLTLEPKPKDIVCAQIYDWTHARAETVMRIFRPPYLVTHSIRDGSPQPLLIDNQQIVVRGVVISSLRPLRQVA